MNISKWMIALALIATIGFAIMPKKVDPVPCKKLTGDEIITTNIRPIPYLGGRQSPGDPIGSTWADFQSNCSWGHRIWVDDLNQAHIDWMKLDAGQTQRFCAWNGRYADGTYYGETQASPSWSGYVGIGVTTDADPGMQRTVVTYHYDGGTGYFGWIDIDGGNLWGAFGSPKSPELTDHIWPYISVARNGNIIMVTGNQNANHHHVHVTTDEGDTWTETATFMDSCSNLTHFTIASRNSDKVAFVHTQFITDSAGAASGQLDQEVYYMVSTDGGETWGPHTNITNYQPYPTDSVRGYASVNAIFDNNDDLHVVWEGRKVTTAFWVASNIFHWDEVSGNITVVNSPSTYYTDDWWITVTGAGDPGAWRMPADRPNLAIDQNGHLYCIWHGNDDYNDYSAGGFFNGEIYGSKSIDNGATWFNYTNLTNTRCPGAAPGDCYDEDYGTVYPYVVNDSIYVTYVEDKDSGGAAQTEGTWTDNPVRCWLIPKEAFGIEEQKTETPKVTTLNLYPNPAVRGSELNYTLANSGNVSVRLFDAVGRLVKDLDNGYRSAGVYNLNIATGDIANGTYFIILDTPAERLSQSLVIVH